MKKLAILLPGFLDSKDYAHLVDLDNRLKKQGYLTIRINPTGTWGDEKNIDKYSISQYLDDVDDTIERATERYGKLNEIVLAGHSLGGTIAMLYASGHNNITTVVAIMSPSTYLRGENEEKIKKWRDEGLKTSIRDLPNDSSAKKKFVLPYRFIEDAQKYDASKEISKFKGDLLLIAGEKDNCVSLDQIKNVYDAANQHKELILIEDIGHDYRHNQPEIQIVNHEITNFIKKRNNP